MVKIKHFYAPKILLISFIAENVYILEEIKRNLQRNVPIIIGMYINFLSSLYIHEYIELILKVISSKFGEQPLNQCMLYIKTKCTVIQSTTKYQWVLNNLLSCVMRKRQVAVISILEN